MRASYKSSILMGWSAPVLTTDVVMIKEQEDPMQISTIGIDIGKNSFHFVGFDARGGIVVRRKCSRTRSIWQMKSGSDWNGLNPQLRPVVNERERASELPARTAGRLGRRQLATRPVRPSATSASVAGSGASTSIRPLRWFNTAHSDD